METEINDGDTEVSTLRKQRKVLAVGEQSKKPAVIYDRKTFYEACTRHLSQLVIGTEPPMQCCFDWCMMQWFGMGIDKDYKKPTRIYFCCHRKKNNSDDYIFYRPTVNAKALLYDVRKALKNENWISDYEIEGPLKVPPCYFSEHEYIRKLISDAFDIETKSMFLYTLNLHREHLKRKKIKKSVPL